jgi:hypothetical protein
VTKKIFFAIGIAIAAIIAILVLLSGSPLPDTPPTFQNEKLGLIVNTPTNQVTLEQLKKTYAEASSTGAGRNNVYLFWNHIEPEQEKYNWKELDVLMSLNKINNLQVTLYFSIINGRIIGPYPDWMGTPGFGTNLEQKTTRTLDAILTRYGENIDYVIIGGGLDSYFDDADGSVGLYKEYFQNVYEELKQKHPNGKIGNAFSLNNVLNKNLQNYVSEFANTGDFVAFTYLPVDRINDITKTPSQAQEDLQKTLELVPENKIAFFEISWSTSDMVNGNEQSQVEFIQKSYEFFRQNESKIEFFTWYRQFDKPDGSCAIEQKFDDSQVSIAGSDQFVRERLASYTCNAGLVKTDNTQKAGLAELKRQIESSNIAS